MVSEGHPLGNHTHSHAKPGALADDALIDEIETTDALIRETYRRAGVPAPDTIPLRLPYGLMPEDSRAGVLARLQRELQGWTAILDDWQRPAPSPLFDAMCAHVDAQRAHGNVTCCSAPTDRVTARRDPIRSKRCACS